MTVLAMIFVLTLTLWAGIMIYSWATTYPMFRGVGTGEFITVHKAYERGLPLGVYLPFSLMGLAVLAAVVLRPMDIPAVAVWLAAAALVGGIVTTAFCAAPMHLQLIKEGKDAAKIERMLACNAWRAAAAVVGLVAAVLTLMSRG